MIKIKKDQNREIIITKSGKYVVELVGEGAHVDIWGIFRGKGKDKIDIEVQVNHKAENTTANTHIRGVLADHSRAKVTGMIRIFPGAQKTNSFLTEKILLLSRRARAEVIPNLEIEADDVKASHAATVGKIDEDQLFYLMSRGMSKYKAKKMIVEGFLEPVKRRIVNHKS